MSDKKLRYSVFTKPWKNCSLDELGELVHKMGFDGVEYPLRPGYQVEPSEGVKGIVRLSETLAKHDVSVESIASGVDVALVDGTYKTQGAGEAVFEGCARAGVPIIRICQNMDLNLGFHKNIEKIKRQYDAILPLCEKYNVTLGVQMHCGVSVFNSAELYLLVKDYDPKYIAAVWDSGHSGLAMTEPEIAIDTVWNNLCMVNFKGAYYRRINGPEADEAKWRAYWTTAEHAQGSWKRAVDYLKTRGYKGAVCLPAEYSDEPNVEAYIAKDIKYIKGLFA